MLGNVYLERWIEWCCSSTVSVELIVMLTVTGSHPDCTLYCRQCSIMTHMKLYSTCAGIQLDCSLHYDFMLHGIVQGEWGDGLVVVYTVQETTTMRYMH